MDVFIISYYFYLLGYFFDKIINNTIIIYHILMFLPFIIIMSYDKEFLFFINLLVKEYIV